jgi:2-polyprenyl-6-methoxyphenol hydroxylase-like FAD-dependent oxidoreductase
MSDCIAVVGGGPGGLFLATLLARRDPAAVVTLYERNRRTDAFGFGVVFSDATLRGIDSVDPVLRDALRDYGRHWDRIEVRSGGERITFAGNGMAAIHRRTLLHLLQDNAEAAGVDVRYSTEAPPLEKLASSHDLVVGADGANSTVLRSLESQADLGHTVDTASAKFIWFATEHLFDGLTFLHRASDHGNFAVHAYPISGELSTFIVETDPNTWAAAGLDRFDVTQPPGASDEESQTYLAKLFADDIEGAPLVANNSRWGNFRTGRTRRWFVDNVVLLGDAVHTAHFSVGSGTKMAMEDAIELAQQVADASDLPSALTGYQEARKPAVAKIQDAAVPSLAWWERFGQYQRELDPFTFAFHFFSRSIAVDKMAQRDPVLVKVARDRWTARHDEDALLTPLEIAGRRTQGRLLELRHEEGRCWLSEAGRRLTAVPSGTGAAAVSLVHAPPNAHDVAEVAAHLPRQGAVVITGGTSLTRILLSEEARLRHDLVAVLVDELSEPAMETVLLAGRADAVARPAESTS